MPGIAGREAAEEAAAIAQLDSHSLYLFSPIPALSLSLLFELCVILCRSSAVVAVVVDVAATVAAAVAAFGHLAGCTKNKIKQKQPRAIYKYNEHLL